MLFEPTGEFTESELGMVEALRKAGPAIAVINKVDLLNDFAALEARKKQVEEFGIFDAIVTVSAKDGTGCEELFPLLKQYANPGPHYFDDDAFTDMPEKELVAEVIREKALLYMRDEIPHGIAVVVERFKERPGTDLIDIDVNIYCERESHKGMVIGKGGAMLKKIASAARADCEEFLGCRVNLQCWVKVKSDWRDNEFLLNNFGFKQNSNNR
jgi:GTP-binding protein Era